MATLTPRKRTDGGVSYRVSWVLGGGDRSAPGAKQASDTVADDKKLAEAFKAAVETQGHQWPKGWVKGRGWVDEQPDSTPMLTFAEVEAKWLEAERDKILLNTKKPKSVGRDHRTYELHLQPLFGRKPFDEITRKNVSDWVSAQVKAGASAKSVANRHGLLYQLFGFGIRELQLRADNPAEKTALPRDETDNDLMFYTHGEWAIVRKCLRSDVHRMVDTALATGVRWGELSAIRVGDVTKQPDDGQDSVLNIHISRAWSERDEDYDDAPIRSEIGETRKWKMGPTKSRKGRWVQLSGELADQVWASLAGKGQDEYVFTTVNGNPWRYDDFHSDRWSPAIALAKEFGLTKHGKFHMIRHTFVVWMLADGERIEVISLRLGHASIQITMDVYGGLLDLHDAGTARRMAKQMAYAKTALLPFNLKAEDIDSRPVRTRPRGMNGKLSLVEDAGHRAAG